MTRQPEQSATHGHPHAGAADMIASQSADMRLLVGVAGFEPAASSSRSQVRSFLSWACLGAGLVSLSADVRRSPCRDVATVTQLVTRLSVRAGGLPSGVS